MAGKNFKNNRGVTLIELVAAVALFSVAILSATGIFKLVLDGQRNSISSQNAQENMRYILEKMSKEIRMAELSDDNCLEGAANKIYNTAAGDTELYFKNQSGVCVKYYLEAGRIKIRQGASDDFVTPAKLTVEDLKFYAVDNLIGAEQTIQPYVTILLDVKNSGLPEQQQKLKIQVSISSRYYKSVALAEPDCIPSCSGKECGSDGCGGSCGSCAANEFCSAGSCEVSPPFCGDGSCNGSETCSTCAGDCGACGSTYAVASVNMTSYGSGYTSAPSVSFSGGGGSGAAGTASLGNGETVLVSPESLGSVTSVQMTISSSPAFDANRLPSISVSGNAVINPVWEAPTLRANLNFGTVSSVDVFNQGSGYTSPPAVSFNNGATGVASISGGKVVSVSITSAGSYATYLSVSFSGGGGSGAAATVSGTAYTTGLAGLSVGSGGSNYNQSTVQVTWSGGVDINGGSASGGVGLAYTNYSPASYSTTYSVTSISVSNGGSNYTSTPAVVFSGGGGSGAAGTAVMQAQ